MTAPVTEETTTAGNASLAKSLRMTSIVKNTPASGMPNTAERPPTAPAATKVFKSFGETSSRRPSAEPTDEPICTTGPSSPAEPPNPIVAADATALTQATCAGMRPSCSLIARATSATP